MSRSQPVSIAGLHFASVARAEEYFQSKREAVKAAGPLKDGELFTQLVDLFTRYCEASPGWGLNGRVITAFSVDYERRTNGGTWAQHLCYKVHFSNDEVRPFSVPKALKAIR